MNPYYNLPAEQHHVQQFVDKFNADDRLWRKLAPRRRLRRLARPKLTEEQHRELDLREFENARPSDDCVG